MQEMCSERSLYCSIFVLLIAYGKSAMSSTEHSPSWLDPHVLHSRGSHCQMTTCVESNFMITYFEMHRTYMKICECTIEHDTLH
jgi:hypothetical protein